MPVPHLADHKVAPVATHPHTHTPTHTHTTPSTNHTRHWQATSATVEVICPEAHHPTATLATARAEPPAHNAHTHTPTHTPTHTQRTHTQATGATHDAAMGGSPCLYTSS
jgi:hypothetical protein